MRDAWTEAVICGVIRQTLRQAECTGVAPVDGPGPELQMLTALLSDHAPQIQIHLPREERVHSLAAVLAEEGTNASHEVEARRCLARTAAPAANCLPVCLMNRTAILLSSEFPPEPLLPLADLPASAVHAAVGTCTLPDPFRAAESDLEALEALEAALDRWARGSTADEAVSGGSVPAPVRTELRDRLAAGPDVRALRGIVPKLGDPTPGIDLDL